MYIADMHCDTLSDVSESCGLLNSYNTSKEYGHLQFFAHFAKSKDKTPEERRKKLMHDANVYFSECERLGIMNVITAKDLFSAEENGKISGMLTVEGGGGLFSDSPELDILARAGLSIMGLAWDKNELSSSAYDEIDEGLTDEGRKMVSRCAELGIILDTSHLSDKAFWELFELSPMPHIATHSNFRDVCPARRNLTRDMACEIASRGGVIGINLYPPFLSESDAGVEDIYRHIDYGLELVGDGCVAFGFDIDGTKGKYPLGIDTERSIHDQVINLLFSRYPSATVERICGLNVMEFLKSNLI